MSRIDVRHLGVVGDGVNDTDGLLAAARRGWFSLPPGTYKITRTIELGVQSKVVCEECGWEEEDDE